MQGFSMKDLDFLTPVDAVPSTGTARGPDILGSTDRNTIVLSDDELRMITRYSQPSKQLFELHRQGFHRARLGRVGGVLLERAHYEAVCAGRVSAEAPHVRPPKLRMAR
jgi:hypothetical protein